MNEKICPVCERTFTSSRSTAVTCSQPCRQKLYRLRKGDRIQGLKFEINSDGEERVKHLAPTVREMRGIASRVRKGAKTAAAAASKLSEYSGENGLRRKDDVTIGELQTALQTLMDAERFLRGLGIVTPTEESENR